MDELFQKKTDHLHPGRLTAGSWKWWALERWFLFFRGFCLRFQPLSFQGVQQNLKKFAPKYQCQVEVFWVSTTASELITGVFISLDFLGVSGSWNLSLGSKFGSIGQARLLPTTWITHREGPSGRVPIPKSKICFLPSRWLLYHNLRSEKNVLSCLREKNGTHVWKKKIKMWILLVCNSLLFC